MSRPGPTMLKFHCANCFAPFSLRKKDYRPGRGASGKYCSRDCAFEYWERIGKYTERYTYHGKMRHVSAESPFTFKPKRKPRPKLMPCKVCGVGKTVNGGACSDRCRYISTYGSNEVACTICGIKFCGLMGAYVRGRHATCGVECAQEAKRRSRRNAKRPNTNVKRARDRGLIRYHFDELYILERDRWTCQLCGVRTPKRLRGTYADNAPEIDHIQPISKGGEHTPENTQCACRKCNITKGDQPAGQTALEGFAYKQTKAYRSLSDRRAHEA